MFSISYTADGIHIGKTFPDMASAADYIETWYIYLAPEERETIKVLKDDIDISRAFMLKVRTNLRNAGWNVDLFNKDSFYKEQS